MKTSVILGFLMFIISHISAEHNDVLALLPFSGQGIGERELKEISIFLGNEINKSGKYSIMDHDQMVSILKQKGVKDVNSCNELECARIMGGLLFRKYIAQGRIGRIKQTYAVNLRIIDVDNSEVLLDIEECFTGTEYGFKNIIISEIAKKIVSTKLENRKFNLENKTKGIASNSMLFKPVIQFTQNKPEIPKKNTNYDNTTIITPKESQPVAVLNSERAPTIKKQSNPVKQYRAFPITTLGPDEVRKIITDYDFFCTHSEFSLQWSNAKQMKIPDYFIPIPGDCTIVDATAYLMWEREGSQQMLSFDHVNTYIDSINNINFGGFSDWRLPSLDEAMSIMVSANNKGVYAAKVFSNKQRSIWTCDKVNPETSWVVRYDKGRCNFGTYKYLRYVRLVRSIQKLNSTAGIIKHLDTL